MESVISADLGILTPHSITLVFYRRCCQQRRHETSVQAESTVPTDGSGYQSKIGVHKIIYIPKEQRTIASFIQHFLPLQSDLHHPNKARLLKAPLVLFL